MGCSLCPTVRVCGHKGHHHRRLPSSCRTLLGRVACFPIYSEIHLLHDEGAHPPKARIPAVLLQRSYDCRSIARPDQTTRPRIRRSLEQRLRLPPRSQARFMQYCFQVSKSFRATFIDRRKQVHESSMTSALRCQGDTTAATNNPPAIGSANSKRAFPRPYDNSFNQFWGLVWMTVSLITNGLDRRCEMKAASRPLQEEP